MTGAETKYGERYPDWGWCWRCEREVRLLSDEQHSELWELYMLGILAIKRFRRRYGTALDETPRDAMFSELYRRYLAMTGDKNYMAYHHGVDGAADVIMKHRRGSFGPPCWNCGKLLRSQKASYCPECMARKGGGFATPMSEEASKESD